jgi:YVTN family beta-propeller protein
MSVLLRFVLAAAIPAIVASAGLTSATRAPRSSPIQVTAAGVIVTVNPDSSSVTLLGEASKLAEIPVGRTPETVSLSADDRFAYVSSRDDGSVSIIDIDRRAKLKSAAVCDEPFAAIPVRDRLYVSCTAEAMVAVVDAKSLERIDAIATEIDPRGLTLWNELLLVTHFTSGKVSAIDTRSQRVEKVIETLADANLSQTIWVDEARRIAFLPQTRSNSGNPALLFDTTVFPIVSAIDLQTLRNLPARRISIDVADRPVGIPIDAVVTGDGLLWIVNAASNDISVISLQSGFAVARLDTGDNPRGLALSADGSRIYVNNTLSGTVSVIDTAARRVVDTVAATDIPLPPRLLNGKRLFNSSARDSIARDRWVSCATCHFDGGMDRRTWFFRDGPRNTTSLLGVAQTLPLHWSGDLDELQDVEDTIRVVQAGTGLGRDVTSNCLPACNLGPPNGGRFADLDDLAEFMQSLEFRRRPAAMSEESKRGSALFFDERVGCGSCHMPPVFTDLRTHDVGTATSTLERKGSSFDTPSLRGLPSTAPYLHDGSARTLHDVLSTANRNDRHGRTSHLSGAELQDLVAFLQQIPVAGSRHRSVRH